MQLKFPSSHLMLLGVLFLFHSCAFKSKFFHPAKISGIPSGTFSFSVGEQTTYVEMDTANFQPLLIKVNEKPVDFTFDVESVVFPNKQGNQLNGWWLSPKEGAPEYTILHLHGSGQFLFTQYQNIAPLVDRGFRVFTFDYSGYGFSEGEANRENVINDVHAALDYLQQRQEVKGTKIIVYGQSLGGHLAAWVGTERQGDIDGVVIEGAYTSPKEIAMYGSPFWGRLLVKKGYSATEKLREYHKPLFVIHSHEDETVPFAMGKTMYEAGNQPKQFFEADKPHIAAIHHYPDEIANKIKSMFEL